MLRNIATTRFVLILCIGVVFGTGSRSEAAGGNVVSLGGATAWNAPLGVTGNALGGIYIADSGSHQIHLVDVAAGLRFHIAGDGNVGYTGDGSLATGVTLNSPAGLSIDGGGNLYFADRDNHRIRVVDAETGVLTTVAGTGGAGFSGDGAMATDARVNTPLGVFVDTKGDLYIADTANNRIRRVDGQTGTIETVVGSGRIGLSFGSFGGDGGPGRCYGHPPEFLWMRVETFLLQTRETIVFGELMRKQVPSIRLQVWARVDSRAMADPPRKHI
jgi:hypothetical protein